MPVKSKIAIFGGSFDPIHLGHVGLATESKTLIGLDKIILLPCLKSPHKTNAPSASPEQRLEMLKLATQEHEWIDVSRWEINQPSSSYSWMAAEHFKDKFPETEIFWIIGNDQWQKIETWAEPEKLAKILTFIVFPREGETPTLKANFRRVFIDYHHEASSTAIRKKLTINPSSSSLLNPQVKEFIDENRIYQSDN
ncbi:MAG: nicotinate (nicotinamide) nucleotide adenylyltransferase [Verrucomicrobiota bacterium]|nr:nicotinate (nicotinamide) nucleotide adenylyltransferase [Verrucomicrobiota bacterium]